jgi:hypothetical protein
VSGPRGVSGNPGGRPKSLSRSTRELVGGDGLKLAELWWSIARDASQKTSDRLEASRLLADRGWGKAADFKPIEDEDPLGLGEARERLLAKLASVTELSLNDEAKAELGLTELAHDEPKAELGQPINPAGD